MLICKDGWLFLYGGANKQFSFLLGELTPDLPSIEGFWANWERRTEFCAARGLPYLHVVFPSKPVVMNRFLPDSLRRQVSSLYQRCYLPAAPAGRREKVLYPLDELRQLDATELPFLQQDTHLTALGAATVAQAALARWGYAYNLWDFFDRANGTYRGDLSTMLGRPDAKLQVGLVGRALDLRISDNTEFLSGNDRTIALSHSPRSTTRKRLAVVGDSFFRQCLPFLAPIFRDIIYLRGPGFHADTIARFAPDAVLTGNAERYLSKVPSDITVPDILAALESRIDYRPSEVFKAMLAAELPGAPPQWLFYPLGIASLQQELAEPRAEAERLREVMQKKDVALELMKQMIDRQQERLSEADILLQSIQSSTSWRITRPLRQVMASLRRLR